jgi:hypothetical protein
MKFYKFISICMAVMASAMTAAAQLRMVSKEKLEQVSDPRHSADSAFLAFDTRHIVAEPMNEDDTPKTFVYRFTNVGEHALQIKRLVSSCSCAAAVCTVKEVAPGASAEISVRYNPAGHPGRFERKVFVYTQDGNDPSAVLKLSVDVSAGADLSGEWPVQMGSVRLRRSEVTFKAGEKAVETLRFINAGDRPLTLDVDRNFLPACLSVSFDQDPVEPGEEGLIRIAFDPSMSGVRESMKVILKGLGLPPSQSSITIRIKQYQNE